jgi:acyl-CoA synthetase (AMP-forming)/AMP-acid ligase II
LLVKQAHPGRATGRRCANHFHVEEITVSSSQSGQQRSLQSHWYERGYYARETLSTTLIERAAQHSEVMLHFYSAFGDRHVSIGEAHRDSLRVAAGLKALGIGEGDVLAVQMPSCYETLLAYHAAIHLGAALLPIIHIYGAAELQFILRKAAAKAIILPTRWRKTDFLAQLRDAGPLPSLQHRIFVGRDAERVDVDGNAGIDFASLLQHEPLTPALTQDADSVCLLLYTSGTTSEPKGVQHTHNTIRAEWQDCDYGAPAYIRTGPFLNVFPAGHIGGFLYMTRPFYQGVPSVFLDQWDGQFAAELIAKHRVEHSGGPQFFLTTLLQAVETHGTDISSLKNFGMGAAGITPASIELTDRLGFPGGRVYGSTEVPTVTFWTPDMPLAKRANTDGKVAPRTEVRILDDALQELPIGAEGEIAVRAPEMFVGYLDARSNADAFMDGGWFRTGDIGRLDADGFLTITDRKKDIIIRGGENISSKEVEDALAKHPAVAESAAVAMPDPKYGERVCAFVMLRGAHTLTLDDVRAHFEQLGIARQKCPERLEIVAELPRNATGKVKKFELRALLNS